MCGRIVVSRYGANLSQMRNYANQIMNNLNSFRAGYNIAPGNYIPGIFLQNKQLNQSNNNSDNLNSNNDDKKINEEIIEDNNSSKNENKKKSNLFLEAMKWGINTGRKDILLFNSRSDTINIYPFYKKYKRCIIIIEGYYEWENKNKPYYISTIEKYDNIIFLPGLYNEEIDNEGFSYKSVSIITMNANKEIDFIHERMPVIFNKYEQVLDYLNGKELSKIVDKDIKMKFYLVGDLVNKLSNISKDNIIPKEEIKYNKNGNLLIKNFLTEEKGEKLILKKNENLIKENKKYLNKINELENLKEKNKKNDDNISQVSTTIISSTLNSNLKIKSPKFKKKFRKSEKIFPSLSNSKEKKSKQKLIDKNQKRLDNFISKKK
jgi:putative SOS response-associated peptidase YedK